MLRSAQSLQFNPGMQKLLQNPHLHIKSCKDFILICSVESIFFASFSYFFQVSVCFSSEWLALLVFTFSIMAQFLKPSFIPHYSMLRYTFKGTKKLSLFFIADDCVVKRQRLDFLHFLYEQEIIEITAFSFRHCYFLQINQREKYILLVAPTTTTITCRSVFSKFNVDLQLL